MRRRASVGFRRDMGLLEDAIREHLDLKRKHGAPVEELDRQEAEALGPARRAMAPADQTDDEVVAEHADGADGEPSTAEEPLEATAAYEAVEEEEEEEEAHEPHADEPLEPPVFLRPDDAPEPPPEPEPPPAEPEAL